MKSTGVIRKIDELGRIVIPKEVRKKLGINIKDPMEIYADLNSITLRKVEDKCIFCGDTKNLIPFKKRIFVFINLYIRFIKEIILKFFEIRIIITIFNYRNIRSF